MRHYYGNYIAEEMDDAYSMQGDIWSE